MGCERTRDRHLIEKTKTGSTADRGEQRKRQDILTQKEIEKKAAFRDLTLRKKSVGKDGTLRKLEMGYGKTDCQGRNRTKAAEILVFVDARKAKKLEKTEQTQSHHP